MTRVVLYATLGFLMDALGQSAFDWGFWCVLALFICSDSLSRRQGYESGMVFVATLPDGALAKIKQEVANRLKEDND
jgi:hypothetical protein